MADCDENVKGLGRRIQEYLDCHPRTGWWLASIGVINIILNLLDLVIR